MFYVVMFESDVIPDSGKTSGDTYHTGCTFESDVIPDSGKTICGLMKRT